MKIRIMRKKENEEGFSYVEVIVAILIMTVGIVTVLSALSLAMVRQSEAEKINIARQIASSTLESIFAVRDQQSSGDLSNWGSINNVGASQGVFLTGWNNVSELPGEDGIYGTADDDGNEIIGFQRRITIEELDAGSSVAAVHKRIEISVRYRIGALQRERTTNSVISNLPSTY